MAIIEILQVLPSIMIKKVSKNIFEYDNFQALFLHMDSKQIFKNERKMLLSKCQKGAWKSLKAQFEFY